jgi:hypothetical protein
MANRSYLYSLSNRPSSYADRPETLTGLSEWPYEVPFSYRVLMSGEPELCASLLADGLEDDPLGDKTRLYAISADFEQGFARLQKFCGAVRALTSDETPELSKSLDQTVAFLAQHRDRYLLLETLELDMMTEEGGPDLRAAVARGLEACRRAGAAVDALSADVTEAAEQVRHAAAHQLGKPWWKWWADASPLAALYGLVLDDDFDSTRDKKTAYPLGLSEWSNSLYFQLFNRAELEANLAGSSDDAQ